MVTRELTADGHIYRVTVTLGPRGWQLVEEEDSRVIRTQDYTDWHRVERAVQVFERKAEPYEASTNR